MTRASRCPRARTIHRPAERYTGPFSGTPAAVMIGSGGKLALESIMSADYLAVDRAPTREEVERMPGLVLIEFGTDWCGFCRAAAPQVASFLRQNPTVRHVK